MLDLNFVRQHPDEVRLALHIQKIGDPLVIDARVERDDGDDGLVLVFVELSENVATCLRGMLTCLPAVSQGDDDGPAIVISQIV